MTAIGMNFGSAGQHDSGIACEPSGLSQRQHRIRHSVTRRPVPALPQSAGELRDPAARGVGGKNARTQTDWGSWHAMDPFFVRLNFSPEFSSLAGQVQSCDSGEGVQRGSDLLRVGQRVSRGLLYGLRRVPAGAY
jgi:hypothetical protein